MRCTRTIGLLAIAWVLTAAASATSAPERSAGTLAVDATTRPFYRFDASFCPAGIRSPGACVRFVSKEAIRGLGAATVTYTKILPGDDEACAVIQFGTAVIEVAGRGTLELSRPGRVCGAIAPATVGPLDYAVANGTGAYSGASGTLIFSSSVYAADPGCGPCGTAQDTWTGTITVPGLEFDLTPPMITGAAPKTLRAPKKAKGKRVRYAVTATDAVDGAVPVDCMPRSGSTFKRGRTTVKCSATDSSANTTRAQFVITVK